MNVQRNGMKKETGSSSVSDEEWGGSGETLVSVENCGKQN